MRSTYLISALTGLAAAVPRPSPQDLDFGEIDAAPAPTADGPAVTAVSQPVTYNEDAAAVSASVSVASDLSASPTTTPAKRALDVRGVNDPCSPQPDGYGPSPSKDTDYAFEDFDQFSVSSKYLPFLKHHHSQNCPVDRQQRPYTARLHPFLFQPQRFHQCQQLHGSLYAPHLRYHQMSRILRRRRPMHCLQHLL